MPRLAQTQERYLHSPRLVSDGSGGATLYAIAWQGEGECVLRIPVSADGTLSDEELLPMRDKVVSLTRGDRVEETDASDVELSERRGDERVWVTHSDGVARVFLSRPTHPDVLVFSARGSALSPTLARGQAGTWVAFHHDVREDTGGEDIAKWIALRFVSDAGQVFEPSAPMLDRDRDRAGVEQSFEFPTLVVGSDGAVALFGRGSHNFWRQDVNAGGYQPRIALSDGEWGSRGRYVAAAVIRSGVIVARRDRRGVEVDVVPEPSGGAPALRPLVLENTPSNLARVARPSRDPAKRRQLVTLFGDIQQHSAHSDGLGSAHEAYLRARYRYGDDFVALTDHESFLGKRTGPGEWEYLQRVADRYHDEGSFVTLYAYEWTGKMYPGPGHKCVYFPRFGMPLVSRDDVPDGKQLVERIKQLGGFASPHHIGWTGADEAGHDDAGQPVWEICSCHGCYEHIDHPLGARGELREQMADVMLRRGHRFGFTASSDSHGLLWHHGESRKRDPYRTGLTAVQARSVSREAIMEALVARRCYATSGAKILLDVSANGQPMGSELAATEDVLFSVQAVGEKPIVCVELMGQQGLLLREHFNDVEVQLEARVKSAFVYARVTQQDGEMAWSSPVFIGEKRNA